MFVYEKKLQYPVHIKNSNPKLAVVIISQYGGPYCIKLLSITEYKPGPPGESGGPVALFPKAP